jgi:hypothetical protein
MCAYEVMVMPMARTVLLYFDVYDTVSPTCKQKLGGLGVESHLGLMTRCLLLFDSCGLVFVEGGGRPLSREDGSVICIPKRQRTSNLSTRSHDLFFFFSYPIALHKLVLFIVTTARSSNPTKPKLTLT